MNKTANLNRITKILEKSANILLRDFIEIENLQNNYNAAAKFANSSYEKITEIFINEFKDKENIELVSGKKISENQESKEFYIISPIDGIVNFSRAIPDFSSFIFYGIINDNNEREIIESSMILPLFNQNFISVKNSGIFCNNRRVKINNKNNSIIAISDVKFSNLAKDKNIRISGSFSSDIAKFILGKIDQIIFDDINLSNIFKLYISESGAIIEEKDNYFIAKR
jgi:fructose-1,6-bisphosphatase/inositol monophosphatase family enzyme